MEIRKEINLKEIHEKGDTYKEDIRAMLKDWGFDPTIPVIWRDDHIRPVRIYTQEIEEKNNDS